MNTRQTPQRLPACIPHASHMHTIGSPNCTPNAPQLHTPNAPQLHGRDSSANPKISLNACRNPPTGKTNFRRVTPASRLDPVDKLLLLPPALLGLHLCIPPSGFRTKKGAETKGPCSKVTRNHKYRPPRPRHVKPWAFKRNVQTLPLLSCSLVAAYAV